MTPTKDMMLSSPDPLGMSNNSIFSQSPTKKGRCASITPRKALVEASGNPQIQEFYINTPPNPKRNASPRKSSRQTPQPTSPWRIRLTVQAEPVDEIQKSGKSPAIRLTEQTTTITVPLKDGDDTPPPMEKKSRGRPRKSLDGPVKRSGTPKPKAGGKRRTMPESPKKQDIDEGMEMATPNKKSRGRPKKNVESKDVKRTLDLSRENDLDVWLGSSLYGGEETVKTRSKSSRTRSRGRRQEITPMKIAVDSNTESLYNSAGDAGDDHKEGAWSPGRRLYESDQPDQNVSQPIVYEAPASHMEQNLNPVLSCEHSMLGQQDENEWRSMIRRNTPLSSPQRDDAQEQIEFDPTVPLQEYDSILESEGFSMVSVSSLPSVNEGSVSPLQQYGTLHDRTPTMKSSPSVPPDQEFANIQSSPRQLEPLSDGTPKLAKVVRAGIALQEVLGPRDHGQKLGSPFQESRKPSPFSTVDKPALQCEIPSPLPEEKSLEERSGDLFRGFGAGTRRELKAGLRLGEELAKRQHRSSQQSVIAIKEGDDVFQPTNCIDYPRFPASDSEESYILKPPGSEKRIGYALLSNNQLPSPERSLLGEEEDRMSWKVETPIKQEEPPPWTSAPILVSDCSMGPNASAIDHTMMARQEEWQREREAVSKQIQMANKSQVIIIDSDDEEEEQEQKLGQELDEDFTDSDIWQAEEESADQSIETTPEPPEILLQPEIFKPRRSKIPSPWRRNSEVNYSDEVEPTESDLFWQPDHLQAEASKRRNARKGQAQGHSDMSAEYDFDISLEKTRNAEAQIQHELEAVKASPAEGLLLSNDEESSTVESAEHTLDNHSMEPSDQTAKSPIVVSHSEAHTLPELTPISKISPTKNVIEVSKKITALKIADDPSVSTISRASKEGKAAIDPRLFEKKTRSPSAFDQPVQSIRPIQFLRPTQSSTSWLARMTAPIWSVFAPAASLPPAATKEDILCSSPYEPLCQLTPWEECHFRALGPLYYGSLLYGAHLFPFNPCSPSARYCGEYVTTKSGWSRKITPEDCGVTDAFMVLLDERGFALGEPGAQWIDEGKVIAKCVALWVGMVKRGEIEVDKSKGERVGLRDQGDRKWMNDDIDWASNQSEYFERKRREFEGLPSWKNKA